MRLAAVLLAINLFQPHIPKTWTDPAVVSLELPLATPQYSPTHISEKLYYQIPVRVIYKSYPVYSPGREPNGYMEWLKQQEPAIAFDSSELRSREDWVKAGEIVFNTPTSYTPVYFSAADMHDPSFFGKNGMPVASDGSAPFARWVIRKKGQVELGSMGCNTCHTRVMADGTVVPGAPGNNPGDREGALMLQRASQAGHPAAVLARMRAFARQFEMPWLRDDPNRCVESMSLNELIAAGEAIPAGVTARSNTSLVLPPQIPNLIGVGERRYLDHTGLVRQRNIGDLMRYASLAQDVSAFDTYPGSQAPSLKLGHAMRYSDEQLYALALYLYSLRQPPNPNQFDELAKQGKSVFEREGCALCHTPPLYTNNKLTPVDGFDPSTEEKRRLDILEIRVGTDARYALETHKGTGYYKVPSLKGVWYRGPFGHNGSVATLEDWFNPARLRDDYVPGGFKGYDGKARSVKGHRFGMDLTPRDRSALIAFLRTL